MKAQPENRRFVRLFKIAGLSVIALTCLVLAAVYIFLSYRAEDLLSKRIIEEIQKRGAKDVFVGKLSFSATHGELESLRFNYNESIFSVTGLSLFYKAETIKEYVLPSDSEKKRPLASSSIPLGEGKTIALPFNTLTIDSLSLNQDALQARDIVFEFGHNAVSLRGDFRTSHTPFFSARCSLHGDGALSGLLEPEKELAAQDFSFKFAPIQIEGKPFEEKPSLTASTEKIQLLMQDSIVGEGSARINAFEESGVVYSQIDLDGEKLFPEAQIKARYNLKERDGRLEYQTGFLSLPELTEVFDTVLPLPNWLTIDSGLLSLSGESPLPQIFPSTSTLLLSDFKGEIFGVSIDGGAARAPMVVTDSAISISKGTALAQQLSFGVNGDSLSSRWMARIPLQEKTPIAFELQGARVNAIGGQVDIGRFALGESTVIPLAFSGVSLQEILALYPSSPVQGSGRLNASVPLTLTSAGVSIRDGKLQSSPPGGELQYRPKDPLAARELFGAQFRYVLDALENYHYRELKSDVELRPDGELILRLSIEGKSVVMNKSQPVNVNITLEENLLKLLESIRTVSRFSPTKGG